LTTRLGERSVPAAMSLATGTRLGPYEILEPLGAGGMGEVYSARDTRLERKVAVKILPRSGSSTAESRLRFEREAKAISQLSHPHICALFDVGSADGTDYLVMELLEGETLAARLARGPLPLDDALRHGAAIADALDRAHGSGIVHRDLKPQNVMLTRAGAKLLDFGLAKPLGRLFPGSAASELETASAAVALTGEGTLVGTLHYMAPEQLEGRPADARSDVFALGGVLYEMLTGKRPFDGTSPAAVVSAILHREPSPLPNLRPGCPPALDALVRVCLAKDADERWQSAHDVKLQLVALAAAGSAMTAAATPAPRHLIPWTVAGICAAVALGALLRPGPAGREGAPGVRFYVHPPEGQTLFDFVEGGPIALSPDGSRLAMIASGGTATSTSSFTFDPSANRIWLRPLASVEARPLEGTEQALSLFWSPDGRSLGFLAGAKLKRLELASGVTLPICEVRKGVSLHGSWGSDGQILFSTAEGVAIFRVATTAGAPEEVLALKDVPGAARVHWPTPLPDSRRFLFLARLPDGSSNLMLAEAGRPIREVARDVESVASYVEPGLLVFVRDGTLLGQPFDAASGRLAGEPFAVAEPVTQFKATGWALFSASRNGVLAFGDRPDVSRLAWFDRTGTARTLDSTADTRASTLRFSPDGQRALFARRTTPTGNLDLWALDVARGIETRLTSEPQSEMMGVWLPEGHAIVHSAVRGGPPQLYLRVLATGIERTLTPRGAFQVAFDVAPDGRTLVFGQRIQGAVDIFSLPLPAGSPVTPLLETPFDEADLRLSPDGRWAAFTSNESGRLEVYLASFPQLADKVRVSREGAFLPRFSRDGRELFYVAADRRLISVPLHGGAALEAGEPRALFTLPGRYAWAGFDVTPDGRRFLAIVPEVVAREQPVTIVVNGLRGVPGAPGR
jgi:dipeptidyl aminopeptidase/acylaminoacyl peptidase